MDRRIGQNIKNLRVELSIKQKELANLIKITTNHLCQIENGQKYPSVQVLLDIASALEVDPAVIVTHDDSYYSVQKLLKKGSLKNIITILSDLKADLNKIS